MKTTIIRQICLAVGLALMVSAPAISRAGGNEAQGNKGMVVAKFKPMKSSDDLNNLKEGDVIVKVCRDCGEVTLIRVDKSGKGVYDYVSKKCEDCGSDNTYIGVTHDFVPLKERVKP